MEPKKMQAEQRQKNSDGNFSIVGCFKRLFTSSKYLKK
jgi:hypothetical protein